MASHNGDVVANELFTSLMDGETITIPVPDFNDPLYQIPGDATSDMYKVLTKLTNADLTTGVVDGAGTFDWLMKGFTAHLEREYTKNRITGAEYTKAYIALTEAAMGNAVQYLLGRDQAFWQAANAQAQTITARVALETAKAQFAVVQLQALTGKSQYALTKLKLATEDAGYALTNEQIEAARGQTLDTRTDGTVIVGVLGKQKQLYSQQITSYQRDAEVKAAKLFSDAWITQKTIDEGLLAPPNFQNASVDAVLGSIKTNNSIG